MDSATELQSVGVNIFSHAYCKNEAYPHLNFALNSDNLCAGLPDGEDADILPDGDKAPCQGDSGGPLVCNNNGVLTLTGIFSYNFPPCAVAGLPTVYGDVFAYIDWIKSTIN